MDTSQLRGIVFDYGNTLIEFTRPHLHRCDAALADALERHFGHVDHDRLCRIRDKDRKAPYAGNPPQYQENDLATITDRLVYRLYGEQASSELLEELLAIRHDTFVEVIRAPDYLHDLLTRIARKYTLALLSNYPSGRAIRNSLNRIAIAHFFKVVVVSGDLGYVKPHPIVFQALLAELDLRPSECLFVGDNWLGDIQGAKRFGMFAAHTVQFETTEQFDRQPGDVDADMTIEHLRDLVHRLALD